MATRIEKIFKRDTIQTLNNILNEIHEAKTTNNLFKKVTVCANIIILINRFYERNNITDEQIKTAVEGRLK